MIGFAPFALAYAGVAALCFAMDKHRANGFSLKKSATRTLVLRIIGAALLLGSLLILMRAHNHIGLVEWIGAVSATSLGLTALTAYRPRMALVTACAAAFFSVADLIILH